MDDVAETAGVSRALVSLVMRDSPKVSAERRAAVLEAAEELGYRPNAIARNLASRQSEMIGVIVDDLHNPFHAETVDGVIEAAEAAGYQPLMATGRQNRRSEAGAIEAFLRMRVDGLILTGPRMPTSFITKAASSCPVVLIGRSVRSDAVDSINNDEAIGAGLAVDHLVGLGHCRIAHVDGGQGAGASARSAGYRAAMARHDLADHVLIRAGDHTESSGREGAMALLDSPTPPTAVFAANDLAAAGVKRAAEQRGLSVPTDLSVVGYDNSVLAATSHLSLTTVNQPRSDMGRMAVERLLERVKDGRTTPARDVVTPTLVQRTSTAPPRDLGLEG